MTQSEAFTKAYEQWGAGAFVGHYDIPADGYPSPCEVGQKVHTPKGKVTRMFGRGATFEEAFANAKELR